jgi:hypothetical protein
MILGYIMQTFLPYSDFVNISKVLDYKRLGKQRVEARQILNTILNGGGWSNHPAIKMWRGYENALILYSNIMIKEWILRGYRNTMEIINTGSVEFPLWLGDEALHASHRSNLLRKDSVWYSKFGWSESPDLPYIWPI